ISGTKPAASGTNTVAMGQNATANASYASALAGYFNTASGQYSVTVGGERNTADGDHSMASGQYGNTRGASWRQSFGGNGLSGNGDIQAFIQIIGLITSNATPTDLNAANNANKIVSLVANSLVGIT